MWLQCAFETSGILLLSIKRLTKLSARDSRISDELNNIQFIRRVFKSEVQHPDSYKVLPGKNNIDNYNLKSG